MKNMNVYWNIVYFISYVCVSPVVTTNYILPAESVKLNQLVLILFFNVGETKWIMLKYK